MPLPDDHDVMREARSILDQLKAEGGLRRERGETVRVIAAAMAAVRDPSRTLRGVAEEWRVARPSVQNLVSRVSAVMQSRSEAGPAPPRGLERNRFAVLGVASVDGPPMPPPPPSASHKPSGSTHCHAVPCGLWNVGNTCFLNVCISAMLACPALKQLAATADPANVLESQRTSAPVTVASTVRELALAHGTANWPTDKNQVKALVGEKLYDAVGSIAGGWVRGQQQSAEEALSIMLDSVIGVHAAGTGGAARALQCGVHCCEYSVIITIYKLVVAYDLEVEPGPRH